MNGELNQACVSAREQLPFLLYGELSFDEEEVVESHLDGCADCRAALDRERELSAAFDQVAVEPSPALLRACREDLAVQLTLEAAPSGASERIPESVHGWWDKFVDFITMPAAMMRPAGAVALLAVGFFGARMAPGVLPGVGNGWSAASLADLGSSRIRSVQPSADGTVHIVLDETRQREIDGQLGDAEVRALLLAATKDPVDGLRGDIVALLTKDANAADVRNALVYTIRNDQNAGVRLKALDGLQQFISEDEVRGALTDVLASDVNPAMRIRAIDLLVQGLSERQDARQAQVVDRRMIGVLQELINRQEENPYMRERCLRALELVKASAELF
jgi:anti-sigma factor RsiW